MSAPTVPLRTTPVANDVRAVEGCPRRPFSASEGRPRRPFPPNSASGEGRPRRPFPSKQRRTVPLRTAPIANDVRADPARPEQRQLRRMFAQTVPLRTAPVAKHVRADLARPEGRRGFGLGFADRSRPSAKAAVPGGRRAVRPSPARATAPSKHPGSASSAPCLSVAPPAGHLAAPGYASAQPNPRRPARRPPRPQLHALDRARTQSCPETQTEPIKTAPSLPRGP